MVRMQIQFTEHEAEALRSEASRRKVSISAVVREAVDERLAAGSTAPTRDELVRRSLGRRAGGSAPGRATSRLVTTSTSPTPSGLT